MITSRLTLILVLEQATGIEPAARPWEGRVLPLYDTCIDIILYDLNGKIQIFGPNIFYGKMSVYDTIEK